MMPPALSRFDELMTDVQGRFGPGTLLRADQLMAPEQPATVSSGFAALDAVLPAGGLQRGRLTLISGTPGSGRHSLALRALAAAQSGGGLVAWIDGACCFDAGYAADCGLALDRLILIRPPGARAAAMIAATLTERPGLDGLALAALPCDGATLNWLERRLRRSLPAASCLLLAVAPSVMVQERLQLNQRLHIRLRHQHWLHYGSTIVGCRSLATLLFPPRPEPVAWAALNIAYPLVAPLP